MADLVDILKNMNAAGQLGGDAPSVYRADPTKTPGYPALEAYDPPWYDRATNYLTDKIYGDNATTKDRQKVNSAIGIDSPLNIPAHVSRGATEMRQGYEHGDYGRMGRGALEVGLNVAPFAAPATRAAGALTPSLRTLPAETRAAVPKNIWSEENLAKGADRAYEFEKTGNRGVDQLTVKLNELAKERGGQPIHPDSVRDFLANERSPLEKLMMLGEGYPVWRNPAHLATQAAIFAGGDRLAGTGLMPWSWNEPGTMTHKLMKSKPMTEGSDLGGDAPHVYDNSPYSRMGFWEGLKSIPGRVSVEQEMNAAKRKSENNPVADYMRHHSNQEGGKAILGFGEAALGGVGAVWNPILGAIPMADGVRRMYEHGAKAKEFGVAEDMWRKHGAGLKLEALKNVLTEE